MNRFDGVFSPIVDGKRSKFLVNYRTANIVMCCAVDRHVWCRSKIECAEQNINCHNNSFCLYKHHQIWWHLMWFSFDYGFGWIFFFASFFVSNALRFLLMTNVYRMASQKDCNDLCAFSVRILHCHRDEWHNVEIVAQYSKMLPSVENINPNGSEFNNHSALNEFNDISSTVYYIIF